MNRTAACMTDKHIVANGLQRGQRRLSTAADISQHHLPGNLPGHPPAQGDWRWQVWPRTNTPEHHLRLTLPVADAALPLATLFLLLVLAVLPRARQRRAAHAPVHDSGPDEMAAIKMRQGSPSPCPCDPVARVAAPRRPHPCVAQNTT